MVKLTLVIKHLVKYSCNNCGIEKSYIIHCNHHEKSLRQSVKLPPKGVEAKFQVRNLWLPGSSPGNVVHFTKSTSKWIVWPCCTRPLSIWISQGAVWARAESSLGRSSSPNEAKILLRKNVNKPFAPDMTPSQENLPCQACRRFFCPQV